MKLFLQIITLTCFIFLSSCNNNKDDKLIVGISPDYPPYEYIKEGEIVGLDVDLIKAIAKEMNKTVEIRNLDFNGLIASLTTNKIDVAISAITVTAERKEQVDFSTPYISQDTISVLFNNKNNFLTIDDLRNKNIGAQLGTIQEYYIKDIQNQYNFTITLLASNINLIQELKLNRIDALVVDSAQAESFLQNNSELSSFAIDNQGIKFAIAMPKNSKLKAQIDDIINKFIKDGTIDKIKNQWIK